VQTNGVLRISARVLDPNHLLYAAPGYDDSAQEVLVRMRVTRFVVVGDADPLRGGPAVTADPVSGQGLNLHFRFQNATRTVKFLDDLRAWGTETPFPWTIQPKLSNPQLAGDGSFQVSINGPWYWMRLHREPAKTTASALVVGKIWPSDGVTPEPTTWMQWNDTQTPPRAGFAGIAGASSGALAETEVDYVLIRALGLPTIKVAPKAYAGTYDLQVATSPDLTQWSVVTNIPSLNSSATDPRTVQPSQGFYRAVLRP
jgi:hypothetical protein